MDKHVTSGVISAYRDLDEILNKVLDFDMPEYISETTAVYKVLADPDLEDSLVPRMCSIYCGCH